MSTCHSETHTFWGWTSSKIISNPWARKWPLWKPNVERHVLPMSVVRTAAPFQQLQLLHAPVSCPNTSSLKCSFKIFQGRSTSRVLWLANAANWCKSIIREIETILTFRWSGVKETFISLSLFPLLSALVFMVSHVLWRLLASHSTVTYWNSITEVNGSADSWPFAVGSQGLKSRSKSAPESVPGPGGPEPFPGASENSAKL